MRVPGDVPVARHQHGRLRHHGRQRVEPCQIGAEVVGLERNGNSMSLNMSPASEHAPIGQPHGGVARRMPVVHHEPHLFGGPVGEGVGHRFTLQRLRPPTAGRASPCGQVVAQLLEQLVVPSCGVDHRSSATPSEARRRTRGATAGDRGGRAC